MKTSWIYVIGPLLLISQRLYCQDIHFTQFYANPLTMNPAQTAWYDGNVRLNMMYRTQWAAIDNKAYQTVSVSAEKQLHFYDHTYGFGLQMLHDESGYVGLTVNKILASGAFAFHTGGHVLSLGIQAGVTQKNTDISKYSYDSQFDLGGDEIFNRMLANGEDEGDALIHMSIHAGAMWKKQLTYNYIAEAGFSFFNINTPYESLHGVELDETKQALRTAIQIGGTILLNKKVHLHPNFAYMMQDKATDLLIGMNLSYALQKQISLYGGTLFRYGWAKNYDASAWIVGAKIKQFDIGFSYDINISSLREATNLRGAFEVTLTYLSPSWKSTKLQIPCNRL